jgi:hypothetical protein
MSQARSSSPCRTKQPVGCYEPQYVGFCLPYMTCLILRVSDKCECRHSIYHVNRVPWLQQSFVYSWRHKCSYYDCHCHHLSTANFFSFLRQNLLLQLKSQSGFQCLTTDADRRYGVIKSEGYWHPFTWRVLIFTIIMIIIISVFVTIHNAVSYWHLC